MLFQLCRQGLVTTELSIRCKVSAVATLWLVVPVDIVITHIWLLTSKVDHHPLTYDDMLIKLPSSSAWALRQTWAYRQIISVRNKQSRTDEDIFTTCSRQVILEGNASSNRFPPKCNSSKCYRCTVHQRTNSNSVLSWIWRSAVISVVCSQHVCHIALGSATECCHNKVTW